MIKENMIAPCGLDCALCQRAQLAENPCPGCLGDNEKKPEFCRERCPIPRCEKRKTLPDRFCDSCESYPCADIMEKETRYNIAYPMVESAIGNLAAIRRDGMEAFLAQETLRWTCPDCGSVICVHNGKCPTCGRAFTVRTLH